MNLVGKIFVVAIFAMSIVWMGFAMAVYTADKNWRAEIERPREQATGALQPGLKYQIEDARKESDELKSKLASLQTRIEEIKASEQQQRAKLETALQEQIEQREQLQAQVTELDAKGRELAASVTAAQANLTRASEQVAKLQTELVAVLTDRDLHFNNATGKTQELHEAYGQVKTLNERTMQLAKQLEFYKNQLVNLGVTNPDEPVASTAPAVEGVITAVQRGDLVEISLGSDDGVKAGHILHVYRAGRAYLGRVQVVETSPDRAAAKILRDSRTGVIQKGDRVATSLKVS